jgi:hypothetical protein
MRGLAESGTEKAMEMKFRKTGFARRLLEQNAGLVLIGQEVTSATEPTESIVMEELRHEGMILPSDGNAGTPHARSAVLAPAPAGSQFRS